MPIRQTTNVQNFRTSTVDYVQTEILPNIHPHKFCKNNMILKCTSNINPKYSVSLVGMTNQYKPRSASRCLDGLLNIKNPYFKQMISLIYPPELQLNKAYSFDTEAPFLDFDLPIIKGIIVSSTIYDKQDDFSFEIVHFPILD